MTKDVIKWPVISVLILVVIIGVGYGITFLFRPAQVIIGNGEDKQIKKE